MSYPCVPPYWMNPWMWPPYFGNYPQAPATMPAGPQKRLWLNSDCGEDEGAEGGAAQDLGVESAVGKPSDLEDQVNLLDEAESLELVEFDPSVNSGMAWEPHQCLSSFLQKHFNRSLSDSEREAIMKEFPKPDSVALSVPKLDDQIKDHLKAKGKDPHFGSEKTLFKIQEFILDMAGPFTCLWAELLEKNTPPPSKEKLLGVIQRSLVLLGSASHQISQERRKVAWSKINPKLKPLAQEAYPKWEGNLFGPNFLDMASKRIEIDKTMSKVSRSVGPSTSGAPTKRVKYTDRQDLCNFLGAGPSFPVRREEGPQQAGAVRAEKFQQQEIFPPQSTEISKENPIQQVNQLNLVHTLVRFKLPRPRHVSTRRKAQTLWGSLGENYNRPVDHRNNPGYKLEFASVPSQKITPKPRAFPRRIQRALSQELFLLQQKGAIKKVEPCPGAFLSNVFTVPKKEGSSG